jgi:ActR/RegA family two-component response regulator
MYQMVLIIPDGMGGLDTIAHLREFDPEIKAIISSGYANELVMADYKK